VSEGNASRSGDHNRSRNRRKAQPARSWPDIAAVLGRAAAVLAIALQVAWAEPAATPGPMGAPAVYDDLLADSPRALIDEAARRAEAAGRAGDAPGEFWAWYSVTMAYSYLERPAESRQAVERAERVVASMGSGRPRHEAWLELARIYADIITSPVSDLVVRADRLKQTPDEALRCNLAMLDLWLREEAGLTDEAWASAEAAEACALKLGSWQRVAAARMWMGRYASMLGRADSPLHFERAMAALEGRPARYLTSLIEFERGHAMAELNRHDEASGHFERAAKLSRTLGDQLGEVAGLSGQARALVGAGRHAEALDRARNGLRLIDEAQAERDRVPRLRHTTIMAMVHLRHPDLARELAAVRAERLDRFEPYARRDLYDAMATGYAQLGQGDAAYRFLRLALEDTDRAERLQRDTQALRLQARYENALRDAETAELRLRTETARLELEARRTTERALWAGLAALALALAVSATVAWRAVARRRQLADLALRDDLTGTPNRRAVMAYGQAQLQLARRMGLPLSLMMVDLDHFKALNDRAGHAVGDAALQAFAVAARSALRGHDQFGRIGGEEWMFVLPGTRLAELNSVFDRLRTQFAAEPVAGLPPPHGLTFSAGGAELATDRDDLPALLAQADRALYRAKQAGRDRIELGAPR
jgi:diguanylate cyclase (GGDEF)-like protein